MDNEYIAGEIVHINISPTPDLAIRILKAYRENCNLRWSTSSNELVDNEFTKKMNDLQDQRAKLLDKAISILEKNI